MNIENALTGHFRTFRSMWNDPLIERGRPLTRFEAWWWLVSAARSKTGSAQVLIGNKVFLCGRGQLIRSLSQLQASWRWKTRDRVVGFLETLRKLERIHTEVLTVAHRITLVNYESYQDWKREKQTDGIQTADNRQTDGIQTADNRRTSSHTYNTGESGESVSPLSPLLPSPNGEESSNEPSSPSLPQAAKSERVDPAYSQAFIRFWTVYPRRVGKDAAWKVWRRLQLDADIDAILAGIAKYKETDAYKRGFVQHPATWLNAGRWKDEADEAPKIESDRPPSMSVKMNTKYVVPKGRVI